MYYLISHVFYQKNQSIYGPVHVLARFLKKKRKRYRLVLLPLEANGEYIIQHGKRTIYKQANSISNAVLRYGYDLFFLAKYITFLKLTQRDVVIAVDPLNCFLFALLKPFVGYTLIYYTADYEDLRFKIRALNTIYVFLDRLALKICDQNWCVSSRIVKVRKKMGYANKAKFVPNTPVLPFTPKKQKVTYRNKLIYVGRMDQNMKIPELLKSVRQLYQKNNKTKLVLIGGGVWEEKIAKYIKKHSLQKVIIFLGPKDNKEVIEQLKKSGIGIALYSGGNNWNRYGDSMKVREYQYLGLPVVSTTIPSNSEEITETNSGIILKQAKITVANITSAIQKIQLNYKQYASNAHQLSVLRDKEKILAELLQI